MLQNIIRTIKYTVIIALLFIPIKRAASVTQVPVFDTDTPSYQLYFFWDLRDRESFFQLTNESDSTIRVHIEVFDATHNVENDCELLDFNDNYTPFDTHIYNVSALETNDVDSQPSAPSPQEGAFGFIVITVINQKGAVQHSPVLTGNFRIFDNSGGYEYGAKAAGYPTSSIQHTKSYEFNFNGINGTNQSDIIGIAVKGAGTANVSAGASIIANFNPNFFDLFENITNCADVKFACDSTHFDYGISTVFENSKGGTNICDFVDDVNEGTFKLEFTTLCTEGFRCPQAGFSEADFFVGFVGLNNSENYGNMSTFWANPIGFLIFLPLLPIDDTPLPE